MRAYMDGGPADGQTMTLASGSAPEMLNILVEQPMEIWLKDMETEPGKPPMIRGHETYQLSARPVPGQQDIIYVWTGNGIDSEDEEDDDARTNQGQPRPGLGADSDLLNRPRGQG